MATLKINGETVTVDVEDDTPLLWAIREQLGLTGTKYGCGIAQCGTCTIHIDGSPVRSCVYPVGALTGEDTSTWQGYLEAHRARRAYFKRHGATASDHGHASARTADLPATEAAMLFQKVLTGACTAEEADLFHLCDHFRRNAVFL